MDSDLFLGHNLDMWIAYINLETPLRNSSF